MITKRSWLIVLSLAPSAWLACSSSAPAVSDQIDGDFASKTDAATSDAAKTTADAGDRDSSRDAAITDAAIDHATTDADSGQFVGPSSGNSACDQAAAWSAGTLLGASTSGDDALDAITPDELTIAWSTGAGASTVIHYADRASTGDAFSAPQILDPTQFGEAGISVSERVALSPDGLRIVVVNASATGFSESRRADRSSAFGNFSDDAFANINGAAPDGASVGDPVIGASDASFYYSLYDAGSQSTIFRALRLLSTDPWAEGAALDVASGLLAQGSQRRRPTAISSDGRTLFFYDQVSSSERAAWINESTGSYDSFVDLGARSWAAPSSTCATLYYSSAGGPSIDLFTTTH